MSVHNSRPSSSASNPPGPSTSQQPKRQPSNSCITKLEPVNLSQRWRVENFAAAMKLSKPGMCLRSQVFKDCAFPEACWQLCLYPGGKREENINNVSLFLKMSATTPQKEVLLKAEYRFYFLDDHDEPKFSNVNIGDFHAKPPKGGHSWGLRNIPRAKVFSSLRADQSLLIYCQIELIPDVTKVRCISDRVSATQTTDMLSTPRSFVDAFSRLLIDGNLSDCTIVVESQPLEQTNAFDGTGMDTETPAVVDDCDTRSSTHSHSQHNRHFQVHKCILAAQSDVFRAMFAHSGCTEAAQSRIVIADHSADSVHCMLHYVYTGTVHADCDDLIELIGLSEKYALPDLKSVCEELLLSQIGQCNVCQLLVHADMYGAAHLREACVEYIRQRGNTIYQGQQWKHMENQHPRLVNHVLMSMVNTSVDSHREPPAKSRRRH
jgi:speckle-type POZ protein